MKTIVMGGLGQVGKAIANIIDRHGEKAAILDKDFRPAVWSKFDVLHVCIPYSKDFVKIVKAEIFRYKPKLTIVHSTVPVGTTRKLGPMTAHSPVRGQHDRLEESLMRFVKYVGGTTKKAGTLAAEHLHGNGFPAYMLGKPEDTELLKLLCLSRYLNDLAFYETAYQLCIDYKVSPAFMLNWTDSYNDGYEGTKYIRPRFDFPRGKVGGHCVMAVSKMLAEQTGDKWLERNIALFEKPRA